MSAGGEVHRLEVRRCADRSLVSAITVPSAARAEELLVRLTALHVGGRRFYVEHVVEIDGQGQFPLDSGR
jgi:hypothetical protein